MKKNRFFFIITLTVILFYNFFIRSNSSNDDGLIHSVDYNIEKFDLQNFTMKTYKFNLLTDLLVFLHIEKTGGTELEQKLIGNLTVYNEETNSWIKACLRKPEKLIKNIEQIYSKYHCPRGPTVLDSNRFSLTNSWLFSRLTYGWGKLNLIKPFMFIIQIIFIRTSLGLQCSFRLWKI